MDLHLAQEAALDAAAKGVGLLERIQAGGALLITLVFLAVVGGVAWWVLRRNASLERANAALEREWREAVSRQDKERRDENMALMREMHQRDKEATAAAAASAEAVEGLGKAVQDLVARLGKSEDRAEDLLKELSSRLDKVLSMVDDLLRETKRKG